MKVFLNIQMILVATALVVGCGKFEKVDDPSAGQNSGNTVYVPTLTGPGQAPGVDFQYGGTAGLNTSASALASFSGRQMGMVENIQVNVNLVKHGNGYGGHITLAYKENGQQRYVYFTSLINELFTDTAFCYYGPCPSRVKSNAENNQYNVWFRDGNNNDVWHGFFEDYFGGVIVVIDDVESLGDGGTSDKVSGKVFYKNFGQTYAPRPPTSCWFVLEGPYDCRSWNSGDHVYTTSAVLPNNGYVELGSFTNMSLSKAFNGNPL